MRERGEGRGSQRRRRRRRGHSGKHDHVEDREKDRTIIKHHARAPRLDRASNSRTPTAAEVFLKRLVGHAPAHFRHHYYYYYYC